MALPALTPFILPALFTGGSMLFNKVAADKADRELAAVNTAERLRQKRLDDQAFAVNATAQDRLRDVGGQQQDRTAELGEMFREAAISAPEKPMPTLAASGSNVVNSATAAAKQENRADLDRRAAAMGDLRGLSDLFGDIRAAQMRDRGELGILNSFKSGSQSVLPLELDVASQAGAGQRALADLFNFGAGLTLNKALMAPAKGVT